MLVTATVCQYCRQDLLLGTIQIKLLNTSHVIVLMKKEEEKSQTVTKQRHVLYVNKLFAAVELYRFFISWPVNNVPVSLSLILHPSLALPPFTRFFLLHPATQCTFICFTLSPLL